MKKLLVGFSAMLVINAVNAQVITVPRKLPKDYSVIILMPTIVVNRTMGNYPEMKMNIDVTVENNRNKGYEVKFASSVNIEKVEITRSEPNQDMNVLTLSADTKTGYFYMDAPSYKGSNTYILRFYVAGKAKGIWTTAIQRKAS